MNTHSIHSSISPFQFLSRKFNQFNRLRDAESSNSHRSESKKNHQILTRDPQKILENRVVRGIEKAIGTDRISSAKINDTELNSDKLADRILSFVNQTYGQQQNNDPNFDKVEFFSQIKQGIETGFSEARGALDKLGLLEGKQKDNLNAAYVNIQEGLSRLESGDLAPVAPASQLQGFLAQINQSAEIEVVTKEGDIIKIKLAQSASNSQSAVNIEQGGITANDFQSSSENSSDFTVSIEGNLNEDEQKSLKKLLKQMNNVGHDFFNGNIQAAFNHAQKIGLDTGQIASFSMSLSTEKSVQAVAAYQQTALPDQQIEPDKIKQAADFFSQTRELLKTSQSALEPFENPLSVFSALFDAVNQVALENSAEAKPAEGTPSLHQIIKPLVETIVEKETQFRFSMNCPT